MGERKGTGEGNMQDILTVPTMELREANMRGIHIFYMSIW